MGAWEEGENFAVLKKEGKIFHRSSVIFLHQLKGVTPLNLRLVVWRGIA